MRATEFIIKQGMAEGGAETSWSNDTGTITLQDILELTKHIKQINLPINDNLKSKLLHWEGNPEEIERVNQVTVSNQFPILIMVDEQGQIAWILDGNHRLHKAIQSQAKTIPAKLIKPSNLNDKAKKIFNIKEQGVAEGSLNEWQEADLYHVTYIPSMLQMWHNDTMGLGGDVSTTRNYNYALGYLKNFRNSGGVIFTLDQNRLRRDIGRRRMPGTDWFKGEPPADSSDEFRRRDDSLDTDRFETLIKGGLKPFRKYVKKIQIWLPKKRTIKPTPPGEDPLYRHTYTPGDDPDQHYDVSVNDELMQNNWFRNPTMKATWDAVLRDPRTEVKSELGFQKTQHNVPVRARTQYGTDHRLYDLSKDDFREGQENYNGIDISMEIQKDDEYVDDEDYDNQVLYVTASSKGKELGHVLFAFDGEYLMPQDLEVEERYRGQGIAQTMYDYVKSKGYKIRRSGQQTDAGAGFWDKHKPGKNVWEQGVAENFADGKGPGRPGDSVRHGIPKHATMAELEKASHAKGRKGQLARWQLNMRRGHKK